MQPATPILCNTVGVPFLDLEDPNDVDGDGKRTEPNGQVDVVEQRFLFLDVDEDDDSSRETNGDLEGDGYTLVVMRPQDLSTGTPPRMVRVHVGDVAASTLATETLVIDSADQGLTCIYEKDDGMHVTLNSRQAFNPASADPCGPGTPWAYVNRQLDANDPFKAAFYGGQDRADWLVVVDANADGVPEGIVFTPIAGPCSNTDPFGLFDNCQPGEPIPVTGIPEELPIDPEELPVDPDELPGPETVCESDPVGLPVCGGESPLGPCDPTADGFPDGCEAPVGPGLLCGIDSEVDGILGLMGECGGEANPCDDGDMGNNAGCPPCEGDLSGDPECEPAEDPCDPTGEGFDPEACDPTADLPLDPTLLCGIDSKVDTLLMLLMVDCGSEPDPCVEDPMADGCAPVDPSDGIGQCDPSLPMLCLTLNEEKGPLTQLLPIPGIHININGRAFKV